MHLPMNSLLRLHGQAVKTPPFHGGIRGSNPLGVISRIKSGLNCRHGSMAEQLICNQQVVGSTPTVGFRGGLSTDMKMGYCVLIEYGRIPEWPKGTDCKSAGDAFEGSNPSPSIIFFYNFAYLLCVLHIIN